MAVSHAGITRAVLDAPSARDGIIAPLAAAKVSLSRRLAPEPFDPMATPGIESVEAQGAPPRSGQAEPSGGESTPAGAAGNGDGPARPKSLRWPQPVTAPAVPALDSYSVRLVSARRLYDNGVLLGHSGALQVLVEPAQVRANRHDLEKLGIGEGGAVRLKSSRGDLVLEAVADATVPRGVASIDFNRDSATSHGRSAAGTLIDSRQAVVDVRMETP
jgi:anaerobic selenocysteine-containing dehydrogenase